MREEQKYISTDLDTDVGLGMVAPEEGCSLWACDVCDFFDVPDRPAGRADGRGVNGESGWKRVW